MYLVSTVVHFLLQYFNLEALKAKEADMVSIEGLNHYFTR